jgi:mannose-6-phosphate isomerase
MSPDPSRAVPVVLSANQPPDRFYQGGRQIAEFRGVDWNGGRVPEDWVASTTTVAGHSQLGLSRLPDGTLLVDEIKADPQAWLGERHLDRFGLDTMLLVKLLDAGERLPVHLHPDAAFAGRHLNRRHGKAEAWYILRPGEVHLGFKRDMTLAELQDLLRSQDKQALLGLLHTRHVEPGDTVFVPPGVLHAIGAGTLLAEVQEPEDLSILLEWKGFELDGEADGHLGLGFPTALGAVSLHAWPDEVVSTVVRRAGSSGLLPPAAAEFFRLDKVVVAGTARLPQGFSVAVVTDGDVALHNDDSNLDLRAGSTVVLPFSAGELEVTGAGEILLFRPPAIGN